MVYMKRYRMGQTPHLIDPTGTRRRIQALVAIGYSHKDLSSLAGRGPEWTRHLMGSTAVISTNAEIVSGIYDRLSMKPATHPYANRCRQQAAAKGWLPPLAWDDETIDDPAARPASAREDERLTFVDHITVERILAGESLPASQAEKREVVRRWTGGANELERLTGWNYQRYSEKDGAA